MSEVVNQLRYLHTAHRENDSALHEMLEDIGGVIVDLDSFCFINLEGFRKIRKKYGKRTGQSVGYAILAVLIFQRHAHVLMLGTK